MTLADLKQVAAALTDGLERYDHSAWNHTDLAEAARSALVLVQQALDEPADAIWNAGAEAMREACENACRQYEESYIPEAQSEKLACRECARIIHFLPLPPRGQP